MIGPKYERLQGVQRKLGTQTAGERGYFGFDICVGEAAGKEAGSDAEGQETAREGQ